MAWTRRRSLVLRFACRARARSVVVIDAFANWPLRPGDAQTDADCLRLPFSLSLPWQLFLAPHAYRAALCELPTTVLMEL